MSLQTNSSIVVGKITAFISRSLGFGSGVTWGGEVALRIYPSIISVIRPRLEKIILVVGTNGKTTTASMIEHILTKTGKKVIHNNTGANLKNGIVGTFITQYNRKNNREKCYGIFEVDEAEFPNIVQVLSPDVVVILNLFRDQLDRYGEVNNIARTWNTVLQKLSSDTTYILNADDPMIGFIGLHANGTKKYFGLTDTVSRKTLSHATDSTYCPKCGNKLTYKHIYLSHYGDWYCSKCGFKRASLSLSQVTSPLPGRYNYYNTLAAVLTASELGISDSDTKLTDFKPAFGRQEQFTVDDKHIQIILSKNPAGFNESIETILEKKNLGTVILALNDRTPDGTDVSWIWDVDLERLKNAKHIICTGDRARDMGVRIKYAEITNYSVVADIQEAIDQGLSKSKDKLYILPTYSAMLDMRKLLIGRKIL